MRWSLFTLLFLAGCAASTPAAETPSPAPSAAAEDSGFVTGKAPSRVWGVLDAQGDAFGYLDAKRFLGSAAGAAVLQSLDAVRAMQPGTPDPLAQVKAECGFDPLAAIAEISFTADQSRDDALVAVALVEPPERVIACLGKLGKGLGPVTVAGRTGVGDATWAVVPRGDLLLIGKHEPLGKLLGEPLRPSGKPPTDDYLSISTGIDNPFGARRIALALGPASPTGGTRIRLSARTTTPDAAAALETKAREVLAAAPARAQDASPELQRVLGDLLRSAEISRQGTDLGITVTADDAMMQGALVALAVYGVKRYVTNAKIAEAHATLGAISVALEQATLQRKPRRFPRSAPLVPKAVPAGNKYTSTAADWQHASWTAIGFSKDTPQYYAYEYETSKDGSKATIRARGDLDGDGVESRFELDLVIDKKGDITRPSAIREQEPME